MAAIDDLLRQVADEALRADLLREVEALRENREFGLTFERHIPEKVRLHGLPIRRGSTVEIVDDPESPTWHVSKLESGRAKLLRRGDEGAAIEAEASIDDLVPVREFGTPIFPGLKSVGRVVRGGDKPYHAVINAENYHALQTLAYTCEEQVDAIYIDPPYNTGAKDWKYNNNYVDSNDAYRHSRWLAFMEKRLELAKRLLKPSDSVLIIAIDENELHRLALLVESIFPASKIQMVSVLINPAGAHIIDQFSRVDEQLLFVHIGDARPQRTSVNTTILPSQMEEKTTERDAPKAFSWPALQRSGGNSRRQDTKAKFFPIYIDEDAERIVGCGDHLPEGLDRGEAPDPPAGTVAQWPIKSDGSEACWQLSAPTFRQYLSDGRIRIGRKTKSGTWGLSFLTKGAMKKIADGELIAHGKDEKGQLVVTVSSEQELTRVGKTIWNNPAYAAGVHGSKMLTTLIPGRKFPFPKSLYAVEDALRFYIGDKPNALVIDFFAGSGTTAHAVARLNHADGGQRRSISITNNEVSDEEAKRLREQGLRPGDRDWESLGIFEYVTVPRLTAAVTGKTPSGEPIQGNYQFTDQFPMVDGFEENFEFFTLTYEDPDTVRMGAGFAAIAPILWLMAGANGPRIDSVAEGFAAPPGGRYAVLFDADRWASFVEEIGQSETLTHAFIVTDSDSIFQRVAGELPPSIMPIRLYESYLRSFAINTGERA